MAMDFSYVYRYWDPFVKWQSLTRCVCSVFPQLLQQRAQPSAGALEAGGGLPQTRVRAEERHREVRARHCTHTHYSTAEAR